MGDAIVVLVLLLIIGLVAWPRARRWLRSGRPAQLVDPDQSITVDLVDGGIMTYETNFHPRHLARGRRHPEPRGAAIRPRGERTTVEDASPQPPAPRPRPRRPPSS
jgi:hypothetical protein